MSEFNTVSASAAETLRNGKHSSVVLGYLCTQSSQLAELVSSCLRAQTHANAQRLLTQGSVMHRARSSLWPHKIGTIGRSATHAVLGSHRDATNARHTPEQMMRDRFSGGTCPLCKGSAHKPLEGSKVSESPARFLCSSIIRLFSHTDRSAATCLSSSRTIDGTRAPTLRENNPL